MCVAKYSVSEPFEYWRVTKPYLHVRFLFRTEHSPYFIIKTIRMTLFRAIIGRRSKDVNTLGGQDAESITVIMGGTYSNHWSLLQQVVYVLAAELPMVNSCQLLGAGPLRVLIK
jgi:hypothetical protein